MNTYSGPRPIGVFDSGVGGLTVVGALLRRFPRERVLYVADQAHVPYGGRPLNEICGFATAISAFLASQNCKAVIMACNISSATALPSVSESLAPLPVLGMIAPAVHCALADRDAEPRIGVLATEGTVRSGAYSGQIHRLLPNAQVTEVSCPQFVPLVEAGALETATAEAAAREYLAPLAQRGCRRIILGCTHYPFLLPTLRRVAANLFPKPVTFIDPADEIADVLQAVLPDIGAALHPQPSTLLLTTGVAEVFRLQAPQFLPGVEFSVASVEWTAEGSLQLIPPPTDIYRIRMRDEG